MLASEDEVETKVSSLAAPAASELLPKQTLSVAQLALLKARWPCENFQTNVELIRSLPPDQFNAFCSMINPNVCTS